MERQQGINMPQKTEEEIMSLWQRDINKPLVSICCITYNHEDYIAEALDSFLMQETNFPFEILIHDDASTDSTAEIIRSYENKYPSLLKPIYQTENQYSKGIKINSTFNFPRAEGEYIALCEGDDFWIDSKKLQFQIEKMREYSECHISFHPTIVVDNVTMTNDFLSKHAEHDKIFSVQEIIQGDGGFCPTASLIIKKEVVENLPAFFADAPVGDYFLQILGSVHGGALYIDRTMSTYRIHPGGVWTSMMNNFEPLKNFAIKFSGTLQEMDEFFNFQYHEEIICISDNHFLAIINNTVFCLHDRLAFYNSYKNLLSIERQIKHQQILIDAQTRLITDLKWLENQYQFLTCSLDEKEQRIKQLQDELHLVYTSRSWKYTEILRKLKKSIWTRK